MNPRQSLPGIVVALSLVIVVPGIDSAAEDGRLLADAIQTGLDSTVFIEVERSFRGERFTTTGTGFFVTAEGHILTNSHVVSDWIEFPFRDDWVSVEVDVITIKAVVRPRTPREKVLLAKVVAIDRKRDLALLKASQPNPDYLELRPDTTAGLLEEVFILGFPFGDALVLDDRGWVSRNGGFPDVSINSGRVTSLRRDDRGNVVAIQTDAAINPGNSGGPMITADGKLVGVVYAKFGNAQIGFAITPERVWSFLEEQKIKARFVPSYVTFDRRPVLLKVTRGALLDSAVGGRVIVENSGVSSREFDLIQADEGWKAALEFPPTIDGNTAKYYIVHVFLEDEHSRSVADHRYRIRRQDQQTAPRSDGKTPTRVIENELTLGDYARKQAAAQAVDDGVVMPSQQQPERIPAEEIAGETRSTGSAKMEIDLEDLRNRAKTFYRGGNYPVAAEIFSQIVSADPDDEVARDYLELATERIRLGNETQRTEAFKATDVEITREIEVPMAEVTVYFFSPSGKGTIDFWLDGNPLHTYEFSVHTEKKIFHSFDIEPGNHTFEVELRYGNRSCGRFSFERSFKTNSRWTLRFNVPSKKTKATAYLVERSD